MAVIKAIECDGTDCGKLMKSDSRDFFTIYGNLMIGLDGGLIGNNLEEGKVVSTSYFCSACFMKIIQTASNTTTTRGRDEDSTPRTAELKTGKKSETVS
jgi:hypothetical protein